MRRLFLVGVVAALVLGAGCEDFQAAQRRAPEVYWVMIEAAANVFDAAVVHNGTAIGSIQSKEVSPLLVTRLGLAISPEYREMITGSTVFYVSAGRLNADSLERMGVPAAPGAVFLGFPSKMSLQWFKTRTLFSRSAEVAAENARALFDAMGAPERR